MVVAVIPARYASSRFPGKPLADIWGKSMIRRVWEQASQASSVGRVVVATDDARIYEHAQGFGAEVFMTDVGHRSGTDRCAEVARQLPEADIVLNVQGDEPFVQPGQLDLLVRVLLDAPDMPIATLAKAISKAEELFSPHAVKVVFSHAGRALYFSRQPIPYVRDAPQEVWLQRAAFFKHLGLYAFRREALLGVAQLPVAPLEEAESLEQLRWLAHGYNIAVGITEQESLSIDTPEDLARLLAGGPLSY